MNSNLCLSLAALCLNPSVMACSAADANSNAIEPARVLLQHIERDFPGYVVRGPGGGVYALTLPNRYASDAALTSVGELADLSELTIFSQAHAGDITALGLARLQSLTNLDTLTIQCQTTLNPGLLRAVCTLATLRNLTLNRALPPAAEYACLTNLTHLRILALYGVPNFGDAELEQLVNLPLLKQLTLSEAGTSETKLTIIRRFPSLTNAVFWGYGESLTWSRASK